MSLSFTSLRAGALALTLLAVGAAQADPKSEPQWGLGASIGYERKPYRDFDDKAQLLPLILFENRWLRVVGPTLDLKLTSDKHLDAGLRLRYAGEGYEAKDSAHLLGMADRKPGLWLGASASWRTDLATLSAEVLGDASHKSKGTRASFGVERGFDVGAGFELTPRLVAHHLDRKYVDYYYGVRAGESLATRPAHQGQSTTNIEAGLRLGYSPAPRHRISVDLSSTRLGSSIKDSPLVERTRQDSARVSYLYLF